MNEASSILEFLGQKDTRLTDSTRLLYWSTDIITVILRFFLITPVCLSRRSI